MPAYKPTEDEMEDAFYEKPERTPASEAEAGPSENVPESVDDEETENPTALLPVSSLGGNVKVGDSVTVRVVKVYDDEAEVEITSGKTEKPAKGEMSANEELDAMNQG